MLMLNIIDIGL